MNNPATTPLKILDEIKNRWSPRAFSIKPVEPEKLERIFESARWSASCFNEQPWRFLVGIKSQDEAWVKIFDSLAEGNQTWCKSVPVLVILATKKTFSHNSRSNKWAEYDLGQAVAYISIQAMAEKLFVHQMAGFDSEKVRNTFSIPDDFEIKTIIAIGYYGYDDSLPENVQILERGERSRKEISDMVFSGDWKKAANFINA